MTTPVSHAVLELERIIDAPPVAYWNSNAYAVDFAPDGTRLAIGSGGWYGGGGITLVDLASGAERTLRFARGEHPDNAPWPRDARPLTISGARFDASGNWLALSAWSSSQHYAPAFLCRVHGLELEHVETFAWRDDWQASSCPTAVCFARGRLHVRNNARRLDAVFRSFPLPRDVDTSTHLAHRTHTRVAMVGRKLLTGGGGSLKLGGWSIAEGMFEAHKAAEGLVIGPAPMRCAPYAGGRITAVLATPEGGLLTGALDGSIHAWSRHDRTWRADACLHAGAPAEPPIRGAWATYRPESIVGLCRLEDLRWFSVDAAGHVVAWQGRERTAAMTIPRPGTPRAIAVHPATPAGCLLAVAVKAGDDDRRGYVACLRVRA